MTNKREKVTKEESKTESVTSAPAESTLENIPPASKAEATSTPTIITEMQADVPQEKVVEAPKKGRKKAAEKKEEKKEAKKTVKKVKAEKKTTKTTKKKTAKEEAKADSEVASETEKKEKKTKSTTKKAVSAKKTVVPTEDSVEEASAMINKTIHEMVSNDPASPAKKRILFVGSEVLPFAATGGLGEVLGSLPKALAARGDYDVRVMMPYYKDMGEQWKNEAKYLCNYNVGLSWRNLYCGLFELKKDGVTYYFIDNEYYFGRDGLYGFFDDAERYAFFCKAVMDSFYFIGFMPEIVHANDWQTALIPIYNNSLYHYDMKLIFTIHNIEYQGQYDLAILPTVFGLPAEAGAYVEYEGCINLVKGAIETSDCVTTVSETYAKELHTRAFAHGLQDMIIKNTHKTRGILNGIDAAGYDPMVDTDIAYNFGPEDFSGKEKDKEELQKLAGLQVDPNVPVIAIISRLVSHKGMDLITATMEDIVATTNIQLVVLGKGDRKYEDYFLWLQNQFPGRVSAMITYNKALSRKVYAGADLFLMPSKAEPCGLSQMIACRYGTVPIVRETGGLKDSIVDCGYGEGSGFTFSSYSPEEMRNAIYRGIYLYNTDKENWAGLRKYVSTIDFSWAKSANKYDEMYSWLLGR